MILRGWLLVSGIQFDYILAKGYKVNVGSFIARGAYEVLKCKSPEMLSFMMQNYICTQNMNPSSVTNNEKLSSEISIKYI